MIFEKNQKIIAQTFGFKKKYSYLCSVAAMKHNTNTIYYT